MVLRSIGIALMAMLLMAAAYDIDTKLNKKLEKSLKATWPEMELQYQAHPDDSEVYEVYEGKEQIGYFVLAEASSKFDVFDYMVAFDLQGQIVRPHILIYREDYGGEICSKRWLKQFIGLDDEAPMQLGLDVQNVTGATISCQAASYGFKSASKKIDAIIAAFDGAKD